MNLSDDEIGIAILLDHVVKGSGYPTMRDGILDARLGKML